MLLKTGQFRFLESFWKDAFDKRPLPRPAQRAVQSHRTTRALCPASPRLASPWLIGHLGSYPLRLTSSHSRLPTGQYTDGGSAAIFDEASESIISLAESYRQMQQGAAPSGPEMERLVPMF